MDPGWIVVVSPMLHSRPLLRFGLFTEFALSLSLIPWMSIAHRFQMETLSKARRTWLRQGTMCFWTLQRSGSRNQTTNHLFCWFHLQPSLWSSSQSEHWLCNFLSEGTECNCWRFHTRILSFFMHIFVSILPSVMDQRKLFDHGKTILSVGLHLAVWKAQRTRTCLCPRKFFRKQGWALQSVSPHQECMLFCLRVKTWVWSY